MRIVGQDSDCRLVIDLEGEAFLITKLIPGGSPAYICNGIFSAASVFGGGDSSFNNIPANTAHSAFSGSPLFDTPYHKLDIVNPADPEIFKKKDDKIVEVLDTTDMIDDRFEILDL